MLYMGLNPEMARTALRFAPRTFFAMVLNPYVSCGSNGSPALRAPPHVLTRLRSDGSPALRAPPHVLTSLINTFGDKFIYHIKL